MATNIEIEAKVLITKEEYDKVVEKMSKFAIGEYDQVNYYIETKDLALKKLGVGLRIRKIDNKYCMTLKAPMSEGLLEKNNTITEDEYLKFKDHNIFPENDIYEFVEMLGFSPEIMSIVAELKTHRIETRYGKEQYEFSIDKNEYNGIVDYELEMNYNSLQKARAQLEKLCNQLSIDYEDNPKSKQTRALESLKK